MAGLICGCEGSNRGHKDGWTRRNDGVWVHPKCNAPSPVYFRKLVEEDEAMRTELHLFQGGSHHNELWTTQELLYGKSSGDTDVQWVAGYAWTPETIAGSESGRLARIWRPVA